MLRPVTEVVGSKQNYYGQMGAGSDQGAVTRTAAWINMMLHTERATRGQQRAFVRYGDLLDDWTQPVFALGEAFDLAGVKTAMAVDIAEVHRFIDPSLRRVTMTWDDIGVPATGCASSPTRPGRRSTRIADEDSAKNQAVVRPAAHRLCRAVRRRRGVRPLDRAWPSDVRPLPTPASARRAAQPARSGADRVPHAVRAMVPPAARQKLRKALGRRAPPGSA